MNKIFSQVQSLFSNDNNAASARAAALDNLFRTADADLIASALDAKQLAADLIALPAKQLADYRATMIARGDDPATVAASCAAIATAYQISCTARTCYFAFGEFPKVWDAFCARDDGWNSRMEWLRHAVKEERAGAKLAHAGAVIAQAAANKGEEINTDAARQAALELAEAAKQVKEEAARQPEAVAAAILKLIEKRGANQRAVVRAVVAATFGADYEILPAADFHLALADAEAYRAAVRDNKIAA